MSAERGIERYSLHNFGPTSPANHMDRDPDGKYVRYRDHVAALQAEVELREAVEYECDALFHEAEALNQGGGG